LPRAKGMRTPPTIATRRAVVPTNIGMPLDFYCCDSLTADYEPTHLLIITP
jgi:hypothetical protein